MCVISNAKLERSPARFLKDIQSLIFQDGLEDACDAATTPRGSWDLPSPSRCFDFADVMEGGAAPGTPAKIIAPVQTESRRIVRRYAKTREFSLYNAFNEMVLLAKPLQNGAGFEIFVPRGRDPLDAPRAAFALVALEDSRGEWVLRSLSCEQCEDRGRRHCGCRELARISHYAEVVGGGSALCMDVDIPFVNADGVPDLWCPVCVDGSRPRELCEFTSRRPKWDEKFQDLTLDFGGRVKVASSKNFQLEAMSRFGKGGRPALLFGKVSTSKFVLDFWSPISEVQAFAVALTTARW